MLTPKRHKHNVGGNDVEVESTVLPGEHVVEIVARSGEHEHRHRVTIGAEGAPLPDNYDAAQLDKDLEAARQHAAAMAESKHRKASLLEKHFSPD